MRDTTKKLIYAIEQQQVSSKEERATVLAIKPPMSKPVTRDGMSSIGATKSSNTFLSVADQNFGVKGLPLLNASEDSHSQKKLEKGKNPSGLLTPSTAAVAGQTSGDILFLKRLLFLKASLDNEASLANFPVQFNEAKAFKDFGLSEVQNADLTSEKDEVLMLQSGEDGPLLQLMPPQSERFGVVRQAQTAVGRMRTKRAGTDRNRSQHTYNSLNLTGGLPGMGLSMREDQAPVLLGRIEQNKFMT